MSEKLSRAPMTHTVKCVPPFFEEVWTGRKGLEVRLNDRDYREGDTIIQREYLPDAQEYTGRETMHRVGYVLRDYPALAENHVAFMLLPCAARAEARPAPEPKRHREIVDAIWQELCEKDDRNSPAEYPDMALVTHDELSGYVAVAMAEAAWQASQARPAPVVDREAVIAAIIDAMNSLNAQDGGREVPHTEIDDKAREGLWKLGEAAINAALLTPATSPVEEGMASVAKSAARIASDHAASEALRKSDWVCNSCGALFTSSGGKIIGGTCPNGRPTCPLVPA